MPAPPHCTLISSGSGGQADQGRIPRTIECELLCDLVDGCIPGDVVTVSGVVKARKIMGGAAMPGQQKALFQVRNRVMAL
jgi:DNA replicative helicase MCM subunit Mcm2 (Cdc46/Mcm family)